VFAIHVDLIPDDLVFVWSAAKRGYFKPLDAVEFQQVLDYAVVGLKDAVSRNDFLEEFRRPGYFPIAMREHSQSFLESLFGQEF